jgi:hypothetical protein
MPRVSAITLALLMLFLAAPAFPEQGSDEPEPFLTIDSSDFIDWCEDTYCFMPAMGLYYNRVDGILYFLGIQYRNDEHLHPRFRAVHGWTSAREEGYYQIDFEQPIHSQDSFSFGVSFYEKTGWSEQPTSRSSRRRRTSPSGSSSETMSCRPSRPSRACGVSSGVARTGTRTRR